jgi:uncharacterized membrane protein YfcA
MQTYLWICIILFLAGFTQGLSGFGSILLSIPLLTIFMDIKAVIPLTALAALSMTIMLLIQLWQYLEWKKILPLLLGAIPGILAGVFLLKKLDKGIIQLILGLILVIYALYSIFFRASGKKIRERWAYLFGFSAGCLGGALSAAGPPVIVYTSLQDWTKDQIKVTIQGFYLISGLIVVFLHALTGLTTLPVIRYYGVALPVLLVGTYLGSLFYGSIQEEHYRKVILILLALLGAFMIYRVSL